MKSLLASLLSLSMIAGAVGADAEFVTSPGPKTRKKIDRRPAEMYDRNVTGVIPRATRGGNPLQMLNPKAPAQYGTAEESVMFDPYTGKWKGIKFFTIFFD